MMLKSDDQDMLRIVCSIIIATAFLLMQVVIGPAVDGGYYLLGTTVSAKELFEVR